MSPFSSSLFLLSFALIFGGCAGVPQTPEDKIAYHSKKAASALSRGNCHLAVDHTQKALAVEGGADKIRGLYTENKKYQDCYYSGIDGLISEVSSLSSAISVATYISDAKSGKILPESQVDGLVAGLTRYVVEGNMSGTLPFTLFQDLRNLPGLKSPEQYKIVVDRSIKNLQLIGYYEERPIGALIGYVHVVGANSEEGKRIEGLLPSLGIHKKEIDMVGKVFPSFATRWLAEMSVSVEVDVKGVDRLIADDILGALYSEINGVDWVGSKTPGALVLVIERLRNEVNILAERTETITYAQHQVNIVSAALLMPNNASYIYDIVSGGKEIEYGYVVSAHKGGEKIFDKVIRGTVNGKYEKCQNSHIQNVFGGVSPANFIANDDMRQRCSGSRSNPRTMESLRKSVYSKVVEGVLEIPSIDRVNRAN